MAPTAAGILLLDVVDIRVVNVKRLGVGSVVDFLIVEGLHEVIRGVPGQVLGVVSLRLFHV